MMKYYSIQIQTTYNTAFITKLPLRFITKSVYFGTEDFTGPLKAAKQNPETLNIIFHNNFFFKFSKFSTSQLTYNNCVLKKIY